MIIQGTNYKVRVSLCKDKLNCMSVSVYGRSHVELGLVLCIIVGNNSVELLLSYSENLGHLVLVFIQQYLCMCRIIQLRIVCEGCLDESRKG